MNRHSLNHKLTMLFYRDFQSFTGGHLKLWDYFNHVVHSANYMPQIYFSLNSTWNKSNPWFYCQDQILTTLPLPQPDILFIAGLDWLFFQELLPYWSGPIINLIQGYRHAQVNDPRYPFLKNKAIRICVSQEVATAITQTQQVHGEVLVIPNGVDFDLFPTVNHDERACDLLIVAVKNPALGTQIQKELCTTNLKITLLTNHIPRAIFLDYLNHAKITLFLPAREEGFYLPALEGMILGTLVICPDCVGNRTFCQANYNCLLPHYQHDALLAAIHQMRQLNDQQQQRLRANAQQIAAQHNLMQERQAFWHILNQIPQLW